MKNLFITNLIVIILFVTTIAVNSQDDQASLLLDLKKARTAYEIARQKLENDKKLFDSKVI